MPTKAILAALQEAGYSGRVDVVAATLAPEGASSDQETSPLLDLSTDAREFREAFKKSKGNVRVVMLVSPG